MRSGFGGSSSWILYFFIFWRFSPPTPRTDLGSEAPRGFPLAVVGLGALSALGQVVAELAAVEALEDGNPEGFRGLLLLQLRVLLDAGLLLFRGSATVIVSWRGRGHFRGVVVAVVVVVARGTVATS